MQEPPSKACYALRATDLGFSFETSKTLDRVNLELKPGTLTALVGPNGAGKSTLLHALQGALKCEEGSVDRKGTIALMPQRSGIDWSFPISTLQMVMLGSQPDQRATAKARARSLLDQVGIQTFSGRRLSDLSGGQQQRTLLARTLMQNSDILLLDEPCSAIDPPTRQQLLAVMRIEADAGRTLLVSSHDWGDALDSYDRVIVLDKTVLADGTPDDVKTKLTDIRCMAGSYCCG